MMITLVITAVRPHQYNDGLAAMLAKVAKMLAKKSDWMVMAAGLPPENRSTLDARLL